MVTMINWTTDNFSIPFLQEDEEFSDENDKMFLATPNSIKYNNNKQRIIQGKNFPLYCDKFKIKTKYCLKTRKPNLI